MSRFDKTYCSQCGAEQGPGDEGVSHCSDHAGQRIPHKLRVSSQSPLILKEDSGCDEVVGESRELLGSMHSPELAAEAVRRWNAHDELVEAAKEALAELYRASPSLAAPKLRAAIAKATGST